MPDDPPPPERENGRILGIGICSTCTPLQGSSSGSRVNVPLDGDLDHVALAEPALVRLLGAVHVAAAAAHRIVADRRIRCACRCPSAGSSTNGSRPLRQRMDDECSMPKLCAGLLHQHHAAGGGVVPGVAGRPVGRARPAPARTSHSRPTCEAEVPEVVIVGARDHRRAARWPASRKLQPVMVALQRPEDLAAHVLPAVRGLDVVLADRAVVGVGAEQPLSGPRLGDVHAAAEVDQHEGQLPGPVGLARLMSALWRVSSAGCGARALHRAHAGSRRRPAGSRSARPPSSVPRRCPAGCRSAAGAPRPPRQAQEVLLVRAAVLEGEDVADQLTRTGAPAARSAAGAGTSGRREGRPGPRRRNRARPGQATASDQRSTRAGRDSGPAHASSFLNS